MKRWQFALFVSLPLQIFCLLRCSPLPNRSHALLVLMLSREMHPGTQSCLCWPVHTSMAPEDEIPVWPAAAQLLWIKGLAGHHHIPHSHTTISQHLEAAHQIFGRGCGWWITSEFHEDHLRTMHRWVIWPFSINKWHDLCWSLCINLVFYCLPLKWHICNNVSIRSITENLVGVSS